MHQTKHPIQVNYLSIKLFYKVFEVRERVFIFLHNFQVHVARRPNTIILENIYPKGITFLLTNFNFRVKILFFYNVHFSVEKFSFNIFTALSVKKI